MGCGGSRARGTCRYRDPMARALIVVDVQNDFCEGGALGVGGGAEVAAAITTVLRSDTDRWDHVVATQDHHVDPGAHFAADPDFVDTWPAHCVAGTAGAEFHPALDTSRVEAVFLKGRFEAAYSGFEGDAAGERLDDWLHARGVDAVDVVGIATDHCVRATALDAKDAGFDTTVLLDLTAGVAAETTAAALNQLADAGVHLTGHPHSPPHVDTDAGETG